MVDLSPFPIVVVHMDQQKLEAQSYHPTQVLWVTNNLIGSLRQTYLYSFAIKLSDVSFSFLFSHPKYFSISYLACSHLWPVLTNTLSVSSVVTSAFQRQRTRVYGLINVTSSFFGMWHYIQWETILALFHQTLSKLYLKSKSFACYTYLLLQQQTSKAFQRVVPAMKIKQNFHKHTQD